MKRSLVIFVSITFLLISAVVVLAATEVPNEIKQPGTQPNEVSNLESPDRCENCHGGYDEAVEPTHNWQGSMMANAGRDPIFWATLAIAEQDFDGSGAFCIRCHSTAGYYAGRAVPTNGSGLTASDTNGVDCDNCHKLTDPNQLEHLGVMFEPFIANNDDTPPIGYYGSGMEALSDGSAKLGPYLNTVARHQFEQSLFHRDIDYCGTCHDVSNPAVGDLAHNNGAQSTSDPVIASGTLGSSVDENAAFNNFPFQYGIVERTFSEYKAGALSTTLVADFSNLPSDLQAGAIEQAFISSGGDYADGTPRTFSCQTCHMPAVTGYGANKSDSPLRTDLPLHDMTGGNYWVPEVIKFQDAAGTLRLGGGLSDLQISALNAGADRAENQLDMAASLSVTDDTLKVTNLTGHKLISGYPEGRRMWLNIKWYDSSDNLVREDGAYGNLSVNINGTQTQVKTIIDLDDPNTKIYEVHPGMTQEWANQLLGLGYSSNLPLSFDRETGLADYTLGDLAAQAPETDYKTFHFVLNNTIISDNRIPPYGFDYEEARIRNALPEPADQYGGTPGGTYNYWDSVSLNPPTDAVFATIELLYQPTSWEYVQFVYEANDGSDEFLAQEGVNLLDAWLHTGMAEPYVMASSSWGEIAQPKSFEKTGPSNGSLDISTNPTLTWETSSGASSYEYCYDTSNDDACSGWSLTETSTSAELSGLANNTTYYWHVRANNTEGTTYSNGSSTAFWRFTTVDSPPDNFNKTGPSDGAPDISTNPTLTWESSSGASTYEYCVDTSNDDLCSGWTSTETSTSVEVSGLSNNTTYYWHVRANNSDGTTHSNGSTTAFWSFTTVDAPPDAFNKTSPSDGSTDLPTNPTLTWESSSGASDYEYCVDTSNDDLCSGWTSTETSTSVELSGLSNNTTYYWHVRANNSSGTTYSNGSTTAFWSFTTVDTPPDAFNKTSPSDGSPDISTNPTLTWETSTGASDYEYCYDTTDNDECLGWTSVGTSTSAEVNGLSNNTTYYWHVRAKNTAGTTHSNGSATAFWSFTTVDSLPDAFNKTGPSNGSADISTNPTLTWETSTGASDYEYCYDTTNNDECFGWTSVGTSTSAEVSGLSTNTTYYWHVRAKNTAGTTHSNGSTTAFWSFTTSDVVTNYIFLPVILH